MHRVTQRPADKQQRAETRAEIWAAACAPPPSSFSFCWRKIESYNSQGVLGGRGESWSAVCGTATVMQLSRSQAYPLLFCSFARFSWWLADRAGRKIGIAAATSFFEAPPPGDDVPWSVGVGTAIAPVASRWGSCFIASIVVAETAKNHPRLHRGC